MRRWSWTAWVVAKGNSRGLSASIHSDHGSHDRQAGRLDLVSGGRRCSNESWKNKFRQPRDLLKWAEWQSSKKSQLTLSQGMLKRWDVDDDAGDMRLEPLCSHRYVRQQHRVLRTFCLSSVYSGWGYYTSLKIRWRISATKYPIYTHFIRCFIIFTISRLNFVFTHITVILTQNLLHGHNDKSCWFVLTLRVFKRGIFGTSPPSYFLNFQKKTLVVLGGMLLPDCHICHSSIMYVLQCHCLGIMISMYRYRAQVKVVVCTFVLY